MSAISQEVLLRAFDSEKGQGFFRRFLEYADGQGFASRFCDGVAVGLSGGADSVFLLLLLARLRKEKEFPLAACHIGHGIRGDEATADRDFSSELCKALSVPFFTAECDVPRRAERTSESLELTARKARYEAFEKIIPGSIYPHIALAHNATDNAETVLMNILRGSGTHGAAGIPPQRGRYIRPILMFSRDVIRAFLDANAIPYRVDSTNADSAYTRNYVRNEIFPLLTRLTASPEESFSRFSHNIRTDDDLLYSLAAQTVTDGSASRKELVSLHPALFFRSVVLLARKEKSDPSYSEAQITLLRDRLSVPGDFTLDLESGLVFHAEGDRCYISQGRADFQIPLTSLSYGYNPIPGTNTVVLLEDRQHEISSVNTEFTKVYKKIIAIGFPSAIIEGGLFVRSRTDGDAYRYGGHTHRLKKLFNDKKIPAAQRARIPVVCDAEGILWIPGFGVRGEGSFRPENADMTLTFCTTDGAEKSGIELLFPSRNITAASCRPTGERHGPMNEG